MENVTGGKIAADALIQRGVTHIFTLSGGHITPIYQYLENTKVNLFDTRHEQAAVFMAEAWGRLTRKPGVAMVTAGPGFTNALTAIANARLANSPLVLISGAVGIESLEKLDLQDMRQAPVIEPMVKKALVCHKTERIGEFVDMAFRVASSGRPGPVYLELPVDVLNASVSPDAVKVTSTSISSRPADPAQCEEIVSMIRRAERPIIIAGNGTWYSDAAKELLEFAEISGVPVFTSSLARGAVSDLHRLCFESSVPVRPGAAMFAAMGTDLVILLGARMSLYYIFGDLFAREAAIIQVDCEPEEMGRNRSVELAVVGDIKAVLRGCKEVWLSSEERGPGFETWRASLREAHQNGKELFRAQWESDGEPIHPLRLCREINEFLDGEEDIVVADGGDTQVWMGMTRTARKAGRYLDSGLYGCLGVGIPYANTAKLLYPDKRVCLITGDGSVGFNFMEFETSIRRGLPIVVVISNDLGWGMIRHSQELKIGHAIEEGTFLGRVDYQKLVEALGGRGFLVERPRDIRPALEEAFSCGKTCCINVLTDPTTISPGSMALANLGAYKA